jgi:hypothetical protein
MVALKLEAGPHCRFLRKQPFFTALDAQRGYVTSLLGIQEPPS